MGLPSGKEMPICICNNIFEAEIRAAIKRGARTIEAVNAMCGAGMNCGSCHYDIEKWIREKNPTAIRLPVFDRKLQR